MKYENFEQAEKICGRIKDITKKIALIDRCLAYPEKFILNCNYEQKDNGWYKMEMMTDKNLQIFLMKREKLFLQGKLLELNALLNKL